MPLRTLISTSDLDATALDALLAAVEAARTPPADGCRPLAGRTLCMAFLAASARTRICLEEAAGQLGVELSDLTAAALTLGRNPAAAAELARAAAEADAIAIRHSLVPGRAQALLGALAAESGRPVLNLQSDGDHPIQTLADVLTMRDAVGPDLRGRRVAVVWTWQRTPARPASVPHGLLRLLPRLGVEVRVAHPPGFELSEEARVAGATRAVGPGAISTFAALDEACAGADFVYPQGWGPEALQHRPEEAAALAAPFADWVLDAARLDRVAPDARLLRSLPAEDGEELAAGLLDSPRSLFYAQAAHRLTVMRAALLWMLPGGGAAP
jgi:ornithine carbamoyltransferase